MLGPVKIAVAMFATTILGFDRAVSSNAPWRVAFPAEARGRNSMVFM